MVDPELDPVVDPELDPVVDPEPDPVVDPVSEEEKVAKKKESNITHHEQGKRHHSIPRLQLQRHDRHWHPSGWNTRV